MPTQLGAPLRTGKLRTKVIVQQNAGVGTYDSRGQEIQNWVTYATAWMDVEPVWLGSKEVETAQQRMAQQWYLVETRFISGITAKMRLKLPDSRLLDIAAVMDPDSRRRKTVLRCIERVAQPNA